MVANYDHAFCKSYYQRKDCASIRVGVSPDCTLAYIDILFDELLFDTMYSPLIKVGQPKLPAAFKLAGLGTYFSPYFLDTNDILLQAVAHTDVASTFIDEAFIDFIVEVNTRLRTIHRMSLRLGLYRFIKFLANEQVTKSLGGLTVQVCLFGNKHDSWMKNDMLASRSVDSQQLLIGSSAGTAEFTDRGTFPGIQPSESSRFVNFKDPVAPSQHHSQHKGTIPDHEDLVDADLTGRSIKLSLFGDVDSHRYSNDNKGIVGDLRRMLAQSSAVEGTENSLAHTLPSHTERDLPRETIDDINSANDMSLSDQQSSRNKSTSKERVLSADSSASYRNAFIKQSSVFGGLLSFLSNPAEGTKVTQELTFSEAVTEVLAGRLSLGILISHPKMALHDTRIADEDFESDNENDSGSYSSMLPSSNLPVVDIKTAHVDDSEGNRRKLGDGNATNMPLEEGRDSDLAYNQESRYANSEGGGGQVGFSPYGTKAPEMDRFYRILKAAENNNPLSAVKADVRKLALPPSSADDASSTESISRTQSREHRYSDAYATKSDICDTDNPTISNTGISSRPTLKSEDIGHQSACTTSVANSASTSYFAFSLGRSASTDAVGSVPGFHCLSDEANPVHDGAIEYNNSITAADTPSFGVAKEETAEALKPASSRDLSQAHWLQTLRSVRRAHTLQRYAGVDLAPSCHQHEVSSWKMLPDGYVVCGAHTLDQVCESGQTEAKSDEQNVYNPNFCYSARGHGRALTDEEAGTEGATGNAIRMSDMRVSDVSCASNQSHKEHLVTVGRGPSTGYLVSLWETFILSVFGRIVLGGNTYPTGSPRLRNLYGFLIVVLSILDFGLLIDIATQFFCIWDTSCNTPVTHTAIILMLAVWPGAVVLSPLTGVICVLLGPSSRLSRIHASWSRLAILSDIIILFVYIYKKDNAPSYFGYIIGCLLGSRLIQTFAVDVYTAHIDQIRWTRGWDGLVTSLYADNDKKTMIRSD
jgi:hypothetical protein